MKHSSEDDADEEINSKGLLGDTDFCGSADSTTRLHRDEASETREVLLHNCVNMDGASEQQIQFARSLAQTFEEVFGLVVEKNIDYDMAFLMGGVREASRGTPFHDPQRAAIYRALVRVDDKRDRIHNLLFSEGDERVNDEAMGDTARDAMGYYALVSWLYEEFDSEECNASSLLEGLDEQSSTELVDD